MANATVTKVITPNDGVIAPKIDKDYVSMASDQAGCFEKSAHAGLEAYLGEEDESEASGKSPRGGVTLGEVDTSEVNDLSILKRDGVFYVSFRDSALLWDDYWDMRHAFLIWLLSLAEEDKVVIDTFQGVTENIIAGWIVEAITILGAIEDSPANVTVRIGGLVGGISGYLALTADALQVGNCGELVIEPITRMGSSTYTAAYRPYFLEVLNKGREKGILTDEEVETLLTGHNNIVLSHQTLLDRGIPAA